MSKLSASFDHDPATRRAAWMAAAQAGDRLAYERLLVDSVALVCTVARRHGVMQARLDDVVQATLITVHRARRTYQPTRSYDAWLSAIASRRSLEVLRSYARRDSSASNHEEPTRRHPGRVYANRFTGRQQWPPQRREGLAQSAPALGETEERPGLEEQLPLEACPPTRGTAGALKASLRRAMKALRGRIREND